MPPTDAAIFFENFSRISPVLRNPWTIVTSVLGIGLTIGSARIAKIGDIKPVRQSEAPGELGRLAPAVYESAGKTAHGHITKRGSKYLRTMLIEAV